MRRLRSSSHVLSRRHGKEAGAVAGLPLRFPRRIRSNVAVVTWLPQANLVLAACSLAFARLAP